MRFIESGLTWKPVKLNLYKPVIKIGFKTDLDPSEF